MICHNKVYKVNTIAFDARFYYFLDVELVPCHFQAASSRPPLTPCAGTLGHHDRSLEQTTSTSLSVAATPLLVVVLDRGLSLDVEILLSRTDVLVRRMKKVPKRSVYPTRYSGHLYPAHILVTSVKVF